MSLFPHPRRSPAARTTPSSPRARAARRSRCRYSRDAATCCRHSPCASRREKRARIRCGSAARSKRGRRHGHLRRGGLARWHRPTREPRETSTAHWCREAQSAPASPPDPQQRVERVGAPIPAVVERARAVDVLECQHRVHRGCEMYHRHGPWGNPAFASRRNAPRIAQMTSFRHLRVLRYVNGAPHGTQEVKERLKWPLLPPNSDASSPD